MNKKKRFGVSNVLSKGFEETIALVENNQGLFRSASIPLTRIELDPDNPRELALTMLDVQTSIVSEDPLFIQKQEEHARLSELANTIRLNGVINPIIVYKHRENYRVVAGERRTLASIIAGKTEIDARIYHEKPSLLDLKLVQWIENTAREDLSLAERINNMNDIISAYVAKYQVDVLSPALLREITGLSAAQVSCYQAIINAPTDILDAIKEGRVNSLDKAAYLAKIDDPSLRGMALVHCINGATLKALKELTTSQRRMNRNKTSKGQRGRVPSRIDLGYANKAKVVQLIVEAMLNQGTNNKYSRLFNNMDWSNMPLVSQTFKKFITMLEAEI
ncbi:MAG: ParB/RepB/Spo0J family partition protein [Gammaproteobacteria bacterium]